MRNLWHLAFQPTTQRAPGIPDARPSANAEVPISAIISPASGNIAVADEIGNVTQLLRQFRAGDEDASAKLIAAAYDELHRVAGRCMQMERAGHTLQATALVNEAFLRLTGGLAVEWQDRAHFYGVAARLMRQILVDYARKRRAGKRAGGHQISL